MSQQKIFAQLCTRFNLPEPQPEYRFDPKRRWRIDYFFHDTQTGRKVALEVEGGAWTAGRHTRGAGFVKDMEKYNALSAAGIALVRVVPKDLMKLATIQTIQKTLFQ